MLEEQQLFTFDDFRRMHQDLLSRRAVAAVPPLLDCLTEKPGDLRRQRAAGLLRRWDGRMAADQVAASIFELFFRHWSQRVATERFAGDVAALMAGVIGGLALALLSGDESGWFAQGDRVAAVVAAFDEASQELETRLGSDMTRWLWGRLHTLPLRHPLSGRGELSQLLDRGGDPVGGNGFTVCNTGYDLSGSGYAAAAGANYRLIADLGGASQGLWAVDAAGQSGNPGSVHYCDQLVEWLGGRYHFLPLERSSLSAQDSFVLHPQT
jgi:penicillin amidase